MAKRKSNCDTMGGGLVNAVGTLCTLALLQPALGQGLRGIGMDDVEKYQPDSDGMWRCLNDASIVIPFDKVNDNFCDCPDGSDEPGTSACENSQFFCHNDGFQPQYIPSFKVDDGICDYDVCCDGSDEPEGVCENRCVEKQKEYEESVKKHNQQILEGLAVKKKIIEKAQSIRSQLESTIEATKRAIADTESEIQSLEQERNELDETQKIIMENFNLVETDLDFFSKKMSNSFARLERYIEKIESLESILKAMTEGYNHNFNDPAVKLAAQEYLNFAASMEDNESEGGDDVDGIRFDVSELTAMFKSALENTKADVSKIKNEIISLKVSNGEENDPGASGSAQNDSTVLADFMHLLSIGCKKIVQSFLGIESHASIVAYEEHEVITKNVIPDLNLSNMKVDDKIKALSDHLHTLQHKLKNSESDLTKSYGPDDFLRGSSYCVINSMGDYKYKFCPTSLVEQINSDNKGTKLGVFENIEFSEETNNYQMRFTRGERCWNGPIRETTVDIICGPAVKISKVTEPEKCLYHFEVISPLGCFETDLI